METYYLYTGNPVCEVIKYMFIQNQCTHLLPRYIIDRYLLTDKSSNFTIQT